MGGHRWRVRAGFAARSAGLAAGRHPEEGVRVVPEGDLDPVDQLAKPLLHHCEVAAVDGPADLGAEDPELFGRRDLGRSVFQVGGRLLAVSDQFVLALDELGGLGDGCP